MLAFFQPLRYLCEGEYKIWHLFLWLQILWLVRNNTNLVKYFWAKIKTTPHYVYTLSLWYISIQKQWNVKKIEVSCFPKVSIMLPHIYKRIVLANPKKSKKNFYFYKKKGWKVKIASIVCFVVSPYSQHAPQAARVALLLLYVSIILDFMCYLVWFGRLFWGSGNAQIFFM